VEQNTEGRLFGLLNGGRRFLVHKPSHLDGILSCVAEDAHLVGVLFY
jgi:hypothetical protein